MERCSQFTERQKTQCCHDVISFQLTLENQHKSDKLPASYLVVLYKWILEFIQISGRPRTANERLKQNRCAGRTASNFKVVQYWCRSRQADP